MSYGQRFAQGARHALQHQRRAFSITFTSAQQMRVQAATATPLASALFGSAVTSKTQSAVTGSVPPTSRTVSTLSVAAARPNGAANNISLMMATIGQWREGRQKEELPCSCFCCASLCVLIWPTVRCASRCCHCAQVTMIRKFSLSHATRTPRMRSCTPLSCTIPRFDALHSRE